MKKLLNNIINAKKTSIAAIVLLLLTALDAWVFKAMTGEWMGITYYVLGILISLGLFIAPDTILNRFGKKN